MAGELDALYNSINNNKSYIKDNEGYDENIYDDTKKIPTTGYGFNLKADHVKKILPKDVVSGERALSREESDTAFNTLYEQSVSDAKQFIGDETFYSLSENKQKALIDMSYNMGLTKLNKFENMKAAIKAGDFDIAGAELMDSKYARTDVPSRAVKNFELMTGKISPKSEGLDSLSSFGEAFSAARKSGKDIFEYNGKKFTTKRR